MLSKTAIKKRQGCKIPPFWTLITFLKIKILQNPSKSKLFQPIGFFLLNFRSAAIKMTLDIVLEREDTRYKSITTLHYTTLHYILHSQLIKRK